MTLSERNATRRYETGGAFRRPSRNLALAGSGPQAAENAQTEEVPRQEGTEPSEPPPPSEQDSREV